MQFSHNVFGPDFSKAALVTFDFGNVEVTLRMPEQREGLSSFLENTNLEKIHDDVSNAWITHPLGHRYRELASQSWKYQDEITENYVAILNLEIEIQEILELDKKNNVPFSRQGFPAYLLSLYRSMCIGGTSITPDSEDATHEYENMQLPESVTDIVVVNKNILDWVVISFGEIFQGPPDQHVHIPLKDNAILIIKYKVGFLVRYGEEISLPESELEKLRKEIAQELLDNITVTYSPELLQVISEQN
ncbi:MAG: hypothetical protein ACI9Y1_000707 [Lentisphaeria bacterium]|jgi:hypothetical protein